MRILIADSHALFRAGMRSALKHQIREDITVLEAGDHDALLSCLAMRPDIDLVLCELNLPGLEGAEGLRELTRQTPQVPILVVSSAEDLRTPREAIRCGARGYVSKGDSFDVLRRALDLVLVGGCYVPVQAVLEDARPRRETEAAAAPAVPPAGGPAPRFTPRQQMIYEALAAGRSNKEIGRDLNIAENTVKTQVKAIFRKLGVKNRTQAALLLAQVMPPASTRRPALPPQAEARPC